MNRSRGKAAALVLLLLSAVTTFSFVVPPRALIFMAPSPHRLM